MTDLQNTQTPPATEGMALCMDCCRLHPIAALITNTNCPPGLCPVCGASKDGMTAPCGMVMRCAADGPQITALATGDWHSDAAFLQPHVAARAISWTPDGGLVLRETAATVREAELTGEAEVALTKLFAHSIRHVHDYDPDNSTPEDETAACGRAIIKAALNWLAGSDAASGLRYGDKLPRVVQILPA